MSSLLNVKSPQLSYKYMTDTAFKHQALVTLASCTQFHTYTYTNHRFFRYGVKIHIYGSVDVSMVSYDRNSPSCVVVRLTNVVDTPKHLSL